MPDCDYHSASYTLCKEKIVNRLEAAAQGLKKFNTGRPCNKGHNSDRYTSTGNCVACQREISSSARKTLTKRISATFDGRAHIECKIPAERVTEFRQWVESLNYLAGRED